VNSCRRANFSFQGRYLAAEAKRHQAQRRAAILNRQSTISNRQLPGFTLVEMVIVTAVILVLLGILLPAASSLWSQRREADAENLMQGLLMTTRSRAMQAGGSQTGLFFFLDDSGTQRVVSIEQALDPDNPGSLVLLDVFRVSDDRDQAFPVPMRVVPRVILDEDSSATAPSTYSNVEIARKDVDFLNRGIADEGQRHRNFFTLIHSSDGRLVQRPTVLIQDADVNLDGRGDRTGLRVGNGQDGTRKDPAVAKYYPRTGMAANINPVAPLRPPHTVDDLLAFAPSGSDPVAINFPSVDSVLICDDAVLSRLRTGIDESDGKAMRDFLARTAQPLYVSPLTGAVIRGPVGEGVTQ